MKHPIDIVIPWVDGQDPEWFAQKQQYSPNKNEDDNINRYRDWGLLQYWFRGIEKFAPWVNKIHFVTWGHLPEWLNTEHPKLNIVNHKDYIPEQYLPVFSVNPIELNFHRIEGLSEHFIYFNDDTYLIDEMSPENFFVNGLPFDNVTEVPLRFFPGGIDHMIGNDMTIINKHFNKRETIKKNKKQWFSTKALKSTLKNIYMIPVSGFSAFDNPHMPNPFLKSTWCELWEKEYEILNDTSMNRFRGFEDVNQWLFRYWQFAKGDFVQSKGPQGKFFSIGRDDSEIQQAIENRSYKMICLSDDSVSLDFEKEKEFIDNCFKKIFPNKSSYEK